MPTKKFHLGQVVATPAALDALVAEGTDPIYILARHVTGDWGDLCHEDKRANVDALRCGARILSRYGDLYVITEADRSATTIMLREEY